MEKPLLGKIYDSVIAGIYCLLQDEKIVYIGQSKSVIRRIGWHLSTNKKKFNKFSFLVLKHRRDDLEAELIEKFQPKYNRQCNPKYWKYKKSTWDRKNQKRRSIGKKKKKL